MHRLASLTEMYDVGLAPHCPLGPVALAACIQVDLTASNCEHHRESLCLAFSQSKCSLYSGDEFAGKIAHA